MKTIRLTTKDKFEIQQYTDSRIVYGGNEYEQVLEPGLKTWRGSFWKKINLRHKNEKVKLILGDMVWGFAILTLVDSETGEFSFYGDGELHQI